MVKHPFRWILAKQIKNMNFFKPALLSTWNKSLLTFCIMLMSLLNKPAICLTHEKAIFSLSIFLVGWSVFSCFLSLLDQSLYISCFLLLWQKTLGLSSDQQHESSLPTIWLEPSFLLSYSYLFPISRHHNNHLPHLFLAYTISMKLLMKGHSLAPLILWQLSDPNWQNNLKERTPWKFSSLIIWWSYS